MDESRLIAWVAGLSGAVSRGPRVLLADPGWSPDRLARAHDLLAAGVEKAQPEVLVATGGTGGELKLARLAPAALLSAARAFPAHFGIQTVNTVEVLPHWHVSGLMSRLRARVTGGTSVEVDWKSLGTTRLSASGLVVSLVPTQLQRLLDLGPGAVPWAAFSLILLGGGPAWAGLLSSARALGLPVCPCYGMTETAAMVAALTPAEFLEGLGGVGRALPHARLSVDADTGRLCIDSSSLFSGYAGGPERVGPWLTSDLGEVDGAGRVRVLGRIDDLIITGGKKVSAAWLEGRLRDLAGLADVAVVGLPDAEWGARLVACLPPGAKPPAAEALRRGLAAHEIPKAWVTVDPWPRDGRGKIDRRRLAEAAADSLRHS